jgi:MtrB/PioB family decaheme-associated outer membrane protein
MSGRIKVPTIAALAFFLAPSPLLANGDQEDPADSADVEDLDPPSEPARFDRDASVALGAAVVDQNGRSSKLNEYRDYSPGLYLDRLFYSVDDALTGRYFDLRARRLGRDDADARLEFGSFGPTEQRGTRGWSVDVNWNRTPHLLSNSAQSPYVYLGNGRYQVARSVVDAIQISNINDARSWTAPDAGPGRAGEDLRIARVLNDAVRPIDLGTQRDTGEIGLNLLISERTKGRVEFKRDQRDGSIVTGVGIGDRPPRSVNVQLPEPIDHNTYDFKLALEHVGRNYHVDASYLYSRFENEIDTLTWNSLFHAPGFFRAGAEDYDAIRAGAGTLYATNGAIALSPDNTAQQFVLTGGVTLPMRSSLTASAAIGSMKQDEDLLPFATSNFGGTQNPDALPRRSAEAAIDTTMFNVVYAINPIRRLNLRIHYRYYDMDNKTDQIAWFGNTSDSSSRSIFSQRYNIAYDLEQQNTGADISYHLGKLGSLALALERERKERPQREVMVTNEDKYRLTYRVRPADRTSLTARISTSSRDGTPYNGEIVDQTYAYDPIANAGNANNPLGSFGDHPGLRRFDVTDRERDEFDLSLGFIATESFDTRLSYRVRRNDYDSEMVSVINIWDPIRQGFFDAPVDPTQLGLLRDNARQLSFDLNWAPTESLSMNAFASREIIKLDQRGRYLDENNRLFGAVTRIVNGNLDWQDTTGQYIWDAAIDDRTNTVGLGLNFAPLGASYTLEAGYTHSLGKVAIDYVAGGRIVEDDSTNVNNYAEWTSPPEAKFRTNSLTMHWRQSLSDSWAFGLRYLFEIHRVTDWQQEGNARHQDPLSPWFVRDRDPETAGTSQDRAGSRLVRLGDLLAPSYDAHVALITLEYNW